MTGLPSFQFYPGDYLRDGIASCSLAAQGLWLRLMIVAHDSDNYGVLECNGVPIPNEVLARRCMTTVEVFEELLQELESAGVPSRAENGAIVSRRMVRDGLKRAATSAERSRAGKKGMEARWHSAAAPPAPAKPRRKRGA